MSVCLLIFLFSILLKEFNNFLTSSFFWNHRGIGSPKDKMVLSFGEQFLHNHFMSCQTMFPGLILHTDETCRLFQHLMICWLVGSLQSVISLSFSVMKDPRPNIATDYRFTSILCSSIFIVFAILTFLSALIVNCITAIILDVSHTLLASRDLKALQ